MKKIQLFLEFEQGQPQHEGVNLSADLLNFGAKRLVLLPVPDGYRDSLEMVWESYFILLCLFSLLFLQASTRKLFNHAYIKLLECVEQELCVRWTNLLPPSTYAKIERHIAYCRARAKSVSVELRNEVATAAKARKAKKREEGHIDQDPEAMLNLIRTYWECERLVEMRRALLTNTRRVLEENTYKVNFVYMCCVTVVYISSTVTATARGHPGVPPRGHPLRCGRPEVGRLPQHDAGELGEGAVGGGRGDREKKYLVSVDNHKVI